MTGQAILTIANELVAGTGKGDDMRMLEGREAMFGPSPSSWRTVSVADIIAHCRDNMAHYKAPTMVRFELLPKDRHRQDPKVRVARVCQGEGPLSGAAIRIG